jgi:ribosomal protein L37AE/L43A
MTCPECNNTVSRIGAGWSHGHWECDVCDWIEVDAAMSEVDWVNKFNEEDVCA